MYKNMFERYFLDAEKNMYILRILLISFIITVILGFFNYFIGNISMFLVALVSLALSYPIVNYVRSMNEKELKSQMESSELLLRHEREMTVFWFLFIGVTLGFFFVSILFPTMDWEYQDRFVTDVSGEITKTTHTFESVFMNNFVVGVLTFILSFLVFAGLIFVLVWNASIVAYYLYSLSNYSSSLIYGLSLLPHALLEVGGYVFAGIAGSVLAYKFDRAKEFNHKIDEEFVKDLSLLLVGAFFLILFGAFVETL